MRFIIKSYIIDIFAIIYELLYLLITNRTLFTNFLTPYHFSKLSTGGVVIRSCTKPPGDAKKRET